MLFFKYTFEYISNSTEFYLKNIIHILNKSRKFYQFLPHYCKWKPTVSKNLITPPTSSEGYTVSRKVLISVPKTD